MSKWIDEWLAVTVTMGYLGIIAMVMKWGFPADYKELLSTYTTAWVMIIAYYFKTGAMNGTTNTETPVEPVEKEPKS